MPKNNYVGSLSNVRDSGGVRHGQGTYTYSKFYEYSGTWSNGVKDGKGKVRGRGSVSEYVVCYQGPCSRDFMGKARHHFINIQPSLVNSSGNHTLRPRRQPPNP